MSTRRSEEVSIHAQIEEYQFINPSHSLTHSFYMGPGKSLPQPEVEIVYFNCILAFLK